MSFESFMGSVPTDGFQGNGLVGENLGNTEMASFETDQSAMDAVNSAEVKADFGLAGVQAQAHSLQQIGDMNVRTSEFWGYGAVFFGVGVLSTILFNRYYN